MIFDHKFIPGSHSVLGFAWALVDLGMMPICDWLLLTFMETLLIYDL
jgi:hypothetical protein